MTVKVHQPIEHQTIEQLGLIISTLTSENVEPATMKKKESVTMTKKEVNVQNINHEDEFKECMESYNIQNGADSFDIIANAIAFD